MAGLHCSAHAQLLQQALESCNIVVLHNGSRWEQVGEKSSLGWYGRVKEEFTVEEYVKVLDSYAVRLRFRLRTGTAGLLVDGRRCGMCKD